MNNTIDNEKIRDESYGIEKHKIHLFFYSQNPFFILQCILDYYEILCPFAP